MCPLCIFRWYDRSSSSRHTDRIADALQSIRYHLSHVINEISLRFENIDSSEFSLSVVLKKIVISQVLVHCYLFLYNISQLKSGKSANIIITINWYHLIIDLCFNDFVGHLLRIIWSRLLQDNIMEIT